MNLSTRILLGLAFGVLFGAALNLLFPAAAPAVDRYALSPIGDGFLRLIQFVVVPLVFCSLILGLSSLQGTGRVGRYAGRLLLLYVASSALALGVGLGSVDIRAMSDPRLNVL